MEIIEVSHKAYSDIFEKPYPVFCSAEFNHLNSEKCDCVHYLLFKNSKICLGIIGGIKNNLFASPFSAPFGGFSYLNGTVRTDYIDDAVDTLTEWIKNRKYSGMNFTLPPLIYDETFISKTINAFFRKKIPTKNVDLNYSYSLADFDDSYIDRISGNARRNLKISFRHSFGFQKCLSDNEKKTAYDVISENRKIRGFPLKMSFNQVLKTSEIIKNDFFILSNGNHFPVAAAIVFYVTPGIVQIIYWGDLPDYNYMKTMNYLSYKLFCFYKAKGIKMIDVGPASENSVPNSGLSEFKESIGCTVSPKLTFEHLF